MEITQHKNDSVLVIHVKKFVERAQSIERQMNACGMDFQYITSGDVEDIDEQTLARYFRDGRDDMFHAKPATSCALKHFYAYEYIIENGLDGALILEDDAILEKDFLKNYHESLQEYESRFATEPVIISYENSALTFVPRSRRRKGIMLYEADKDRFTGGYFINRRCAEVILEDVAKNKCELAIDGYHNRLLHQGKILYLWCQPTLVQQGTFVGKFSSSISADDWLQRARWLIKLYYKKLLYFLR